MSLAPQAGQSFFTLPVVAEISGFLHMSHVELVGSRVGPLRESGSLVVYAGCWEIGGIGTR